MSIIRFKKTSDYSIISNDVFRSKELSAKAKGLYAVLMTLPDDWKVYKTQLPSLFSDGKSAIFAAFEELQAAGYIEEHREGGSGIGLKRCSYTVHECRFSEPANTASENQQLLITNIPMTKEQSLPANAGIEPSRGTVSNEQRVLEEPGLPSGNKPGDDGEHHGNGKTSGRESGGEDAEPRNVPCGKQNRAGPEREPEGFKEALKTWQAALGGPNPYVGRFRKALRPLWKDYEVIDVCQRLEQYLTGMVERNEARFISPERFVTLFGTLKPTGRWKPAQRSAESAGPESSTHGDLNTPF